MTYLFTRYRFHYYYNLEDDSYRRVHSDKDVYAVWYKVEKEWTITNKFEYVNPIKERYYSGNLTTFSEMCEYYTEKLIFENI
jgi:hypothetical protein